MKTVKDMSGQVFGRLTVVAHQGTRRSPSGSSQVLWLCKCECGQYSIAEGGNLRSGNTKSCGCFRRETEVVAGKTHGASHTGTYKSWSAMKRRCNSPKDSHFHRYGARGITVCNRWDKFESFLSDMGERPEGYSLDRINNDGNYEPSNCRWATQTEQQNNKQTKHSPETRAKISAAYKARLAKRNQQHDTSKSS